MDDAWRLEEIQRRDEIFVRSGNEKTRAGKGNLEKARRGGTKQKGRRKEKVIVRADLKGGRR